MADLRVALIFQLVDRVSGPLKGVAAAVGSVGKLSGAIPAGLNKALAGLDALRHKVQGVAEALVRVGEQGHALHGLGAGVLSGAALREPIEAYAELENANTRLKVAMMRAGGEVDHLFPEITRQAIQLGNELPGTAADMKQLAAAILEGGISSERLAGGLFQAAAKAKVLVGQNYSPEAFGKDFAKGVETFNLKTQEEMNKYADDLQRLKFGFGVDPGEFNYSAKYMGATLEMLNQTGGDAAHQVMVLSGAIAQLGVDGSTFGTNFADTLKMMAMIDERLGKKSNQALVGDLKKLGVELKFFDGEGKFMGLPNMFAQLSKLNVLPENLGLAAFHKLFGDQGGRIAALIAKLGPEGLAKAEAKMAEQGDLETRIAAMMNTLTNLWQAATGTITNTLAAIGETVKDDLKPMISGLNDLATGIQEWIKTHHDLVRGALIGVAVFGLWAAAAGGATLAVGALGATLAVITSPIGLIAAGIAAVGVAVYRNWDTVSAFFAGLQKGLQPTIGAIGAFEHLAHTVGDILGPPLTWISEQVSGLCGGFQGATMSAETFGEKVGAVIDALLQPFRALFQAVDAVIGALESLKFPEMPSWMTSWMSGSAAPIPPPVAKATQDAWSRVSAPIAGEDAQAPAPPPAVAPSSAEASRSWWERLREGDQAPPKPQPAPPAPPTPVAHQETAPPASPPAAKPTPPAPPTPVAHQETAPPASPPTPKPPPSEAKAEATPPLVPGAPPHPAGQKPDGPNAAAVARPGQTAEAKAESKVDLGGVLNIKVTIDDRRAPQVQVDGKPNDNRLQYTLGDTGHAFAGAW